MRAAVLEAPDVLQIREVPEPESFGERPVLVRVAAVGVCGSDLLRYAKGTAYHYPLVLGHEFCGIVEETPSGSSFTRGDHVAVFPLVPRADDPMTQIGEWALSDGYDYFGSRRDGAMAERLYVPEVNLIRLPAEIPLVEAAVIEPAAVALHGVLKLRPPAAGSALVIGAGPIGALAAQWLRIVGWTRVLVADVDPRKREIMKQLGFEVIDATGDTVAATVEATGGVGVDAAVEASGLPLTFLQTLQAVGPRGQVLVLGDLKGDVTIPRELISSFIRRELTIVGTWNSKITPVGRSEWQMVIDHLHRKELHVAPLISHALPLEEIPATFEAMATGRIWSNKVVFTVADEARDEGKVRG